METKNIDPVSIFISYAHEDTKSMKELEIHLGDNSVAIWHDEYINAGESWEPKISENIDRADIILLLISPSFKASTYCREIEMVRALKRREEEDVNVIPILLCSVYWKDPPYKHLQMLPRDDNGAHKFIDSYKGEERNGIFTTVAAGIDKIIDDIVKKPEKRFKRYVANGEKFILAGKYPEAQDAYEKALSLSLKDVSLHEIVSLHEKLGSILMYRGKYQEALLICEQGLKIDEKNVQLWRNKSGVLLALKKIEDAEKALYEAIKHDPENAFLYKEDGDILDKLDRWDKALEAYNKAIIFKTDFRIAYEARSDLHEKMAKKDREKARELGDSEK